MITFTRLGTFGRLGNQIMQYMAMIGFSNKSEQKLAMPEWQYEKYFQGPFQRGNVTSPTIVMERQFHYDKDFYKHLTDGKNYDVRGYFQCEKYWKEYEEQIRKQFAWENNFKNSLLEKYGHLYQKPTIGIHIRRGDYVGHKSYHQLHINYYIKALEIYFTGRDNYNIIVFSDDPGYCKVHFNCLDNVTVMEGNSDIEDLCLLSLCSHFILSNSSFAMCAAWLSNSKGTIVTPAYHFDGSYQDNHNAKDFWPERWLKFDYMKERLIDLSDVTFTIPYYFDHQDRRENFEMTVKFLKEHFNTNIIVGEQGKETLFDRNLFTHVYFPQSGLMHRTRILNGLCRWSNTPYIVNWDTDVIIAPLQILETVKKLRNGAGIVYPYSGTFNRVQRNPWYKIITEKFDVGCFANTKFENLQSWGGAVFYNKQVFIKAGMENENFLSFGPEDAERRERFITLELNPLRQKGELYHVEHHRGLNSSKKHSNIDLNRAERNKVKAMNKEQLLNYIKTWPWLENL
jgi:hypothetical protein